MNVLPLLSLLLLSLSGVYCPIVSSVSKNVPPAAAPVSTGTISNRLQAQTEAAEIALSWEAIHANLLEENKAQRMMEKPYCDQFAGIRWSAAFHRTCVESRNCFWEKKHKQIGAERAGQPEQLTEPDDIKMFTCMIDTICKLPPPLKNQLLTQLKFFDLKRWHASLMARKESSKRGMTPNQQKSKKSFWASFWA